MTERCLAHPITSSALKQRGMAAGPRNEYDLPFPVPVMWRLNFAATLTIEPTGSPSMHLQRRCTPARHTLPKKSTPYRSRHTLLVYATDGAASQGEGNNLEVWHATAAVAYHQRAEARHGEKLIGTEQAGNLVVARALESAATLARRFRQQTNQPGPTPLAICFHCLQECGWPVVPHL
jgi:hypothetical protein